MTVKTDDQALHEQKVTKVSVLPQVHAMDVNLSWFTIGAKESSQGNPG